jgi:hypothetical protein
MVNNKIKLKCKKDWILDGEVGYYEGKIYEGFSGTLNNGIRSFEVKGELGRTGNFYEGSDYFNV